MASFKNLEMAAALSTNEHIAIKKTLFGLSQKAVYEPTQSTLKTDVFEFTPDHGTQLEHLLTLPTEKLMQEAQTKGLPKSTPVGQYRLEVCISTDRNFAALQLFRFSEFSYKVASNLLFFEGQEASAIKSCIEKL